MIEENPSGLRRFGPDLSAIGLMILAGCAMVMNSAGKALWLDELFEWVTASLPGAAEIWHFQAASPISLDPPLYHLAVHYAIGLFGDTDTALRTVSIVAMLASLWFVYLFVSRTGEKVGALLAMSLFIASGAFRYGYEARTYSLVLAAASGALVFWQNVARGKAKKVSLIGFAVCLAVADSCHFYSLLICVPFLAGEIMRARRRRIVDWPLMIAIAAGNSVMLLYLPMAKAAMLYQTVSYWRGISILDLSETYRLLFDSSLAGLLPLMVAIAMLAGLFNLLPSRNISTNLLPEELATVGGFAVYPFLVWIFSLAVTHTYVDRYALPVIIGLSVLIALSIRSLSRSNLIVVLSAAVVLLPVLHHASTSLRFGPSPRAKLLASATEVFSESPDANIVILEMPFYLEVKRYGTVSIRNRLVLYDPSEAPTLKSREDARQLIVLAIRTGTKLPVVTTGGLGRNPEPYYVVCNCAGADLRKVIGNSLATDAGRYLDQSVYLVRSTSAKP